MVYILLIIGFICLVKGADFFVSGSSAIARHFNIPTFIIGLTIVAFGTSMPEAAVSVTAALKGANGIAVGNVIGSNIFNLLIVLGASAVIKACPVSKAMLKFEYPLSIVATAMIIILSIGSGQNQMLLSRIDGIIFLCVFVLFLVITIKNVMSSKNSNVDAEMSLDDSANPEASEIADGKTLSLGRGIIYSIIGIAGIIAGGDLVVDSATDIAISFGIDEMLVGLTIVALGTSLPELVTSVVAAVKGETDIAVGNVVGSNLFNILFVLGMSTAIHPILLTSISIYDSAILIAVSLLVFIPMIKKKSLTRSWGIAMILIYAVYLTYIIVRTL